MQLSLMPSLISVAPRDATHALIAFFENGYAPTAPISLLASHHCLPSSNPSVATRPISCSSSICHTNQTKEGGAGQAGAAEIAVHRSLDGLGCRLDRRAVA